MNKAQYSFNLQTTNLPMETLHYRLSDGHLQNVGGSCSSPWSYPLEVIVIVVCCLLGIIWAIYNIFQVEKIKVRGSSLRNSQSGVKALSPHQEGLLLELGDKIQEVCLNLSRAQKSS